MNKCIKGTRGRGYKWIEKVVRELCLEHGDGGEHVGGGRRHVGVRDGHAEVHTMVVAPTKKLDIMFRKHKYFPNLWLQANPTQENNSSDNLPNLYKTPTIFV